MIIRIARDVAVNVNIYGVFCCPEFLNFMEPWRTRFYYKIFIMKQVSFGSFHSSWLRLLIDGFCRILFTFDVTYSKLFTTLSHGTFASKRTNEHTFLHPEKFAFIYYINTRLMNAAIRVRAQIWSTNKHSPVWCRRSRISVWLRSNHKLESSLNFVN